MKKILLSIFTILGLAASAQLTEANHAPIAGNSFGTNQCDSIAAGSGGAGSTWDYSALNVHTVGTLKSYVSVASTNTLYPSALVAVGSSANNTFYYTSTTNDLKYYGGNITANGVTASLNYSSPAVIAAYPMSFGTSTTSATAGTVNVISPLVTSFAFTGNCSVSVDGTGTLALPTRTFSNVMRVVTSQTIASSINVNSINYDYYDVSVTRNPILTIATSTVSSLIGGTTTQTIVTILSNYDVVSVNENQKVSIQLSIFPNPATNFVNFSTPSVDASKVIVIDINGKVIVSENMEAGKLKLNTSNFATDIYMYQIADKNNQILTTGKFNVSK